MNNQNLNIIYNYPKTSAIQCPFNGGLNKNGIPTNMSVTNCNFNNTNFEYAEFRENIEPALKNGYYNLNPQSRYENYATDIIPIKPGTNGCVKDQYAGLDPRLYNDARNELLTLNLPPLGRQIYLNDLMTDKSLDKYGQNYKTYSDINAGQQLYYIDRGDEDPLTTPVFAVSAKATGYVYKDPMDAYKPQYVRTPLKCDNPIGGPIRSNYEGCLSFMEDTLNQREDIISKQMSKQNQTTWSLRWPVQN
jgi:hypothetical protein